MNLLKIIIDEAKNEHKNNNFCIKVPYDSYDEIVKEYNETSEKKITGNSFVFEEINIIKNFDEQSIFIISENN